MKKLDFSLPDELIMLIIEYLDPVVVIKSCSKLSEQWRSIIQNNQVKHLNLYPHDHLIRYEYIHQSVSFSLLMSLDLRGCSIGSINFTKLLRSGCLLELKSLFISQVGLALEIANIYNECIRMSNNGDEFEYSLPKLNLVSVDYVCKLKLVSPLEYCAFIRKPSYNSLKKGEIIGHSEILSSLTEQVIFPCMFPHLFEQKRRVRTFLLFGGSKTGKSMILDALNASFPSNVIESTGMNDSVKELFKISHNIATHVPSLLIFNNLEDLQTENETSRRFLISFLIGMGEIQNSNLLIVNKSRNPMAQNPAIRRRFEKRYHVKMPTGEDLISHVKLHLNKRTFGESFNNNQISLIASMLKGYSPKEIEHVLTSLKPLSGNTQSLFHSLSELIEQIKPSNTNLDIERNELFEAQFC